MQDLANQPSFPVICGSKGCRALKIFKCSVFTKALGIHYSSSKLTQLNRLNCLKSVQTKHCLQLGTNAAVFQLVRTVGVFSSRIFSCLLQFIHVLLQRPPAGNQKGPGERPVNLIEGA